jgi:hypothetical protein
VVCLSVAKSDRSDPSGGRRGAGRRVPTYRQEVGGSRIPGNINQGPKRGEHAYIRSGGYLPSSTGTPSDLRAAWVDLTDRSTVLCCL